MVKILTMTMANIKIFLGISQVYLNFETVKKFQGVMVMVSALPSPSF